MLKKNIQERIDSESKYRELFENAWYPMYAIDMNGYFLAINNAGQKIFGCTKEEITGSHISVWLTPESLKAANERIVKHAAGMPVEEAVIYELVCKNREHKWVEVRTRTIKEGNRVTGIHGIGRDITDKMRMERRLKEYHEKLKKSYEELAASEAKYRELFENANDAIFIFDLNGYFTEANNAGLRIVGCSRDEFIGTHISTWLTPQSFEASKERVKTLLSGIPMERSIIYEVVCKNGEHRWIEARGRPIKDGDRVTGIHTISRDITEKKRLEKKLNESHEKLKKSCEELIEADRVKTEFVSNMTHELLTPLTSIKGFTELLRDGTSGTINDEQKKSLEIILRNSERLIHLIKSLLDISNLEKHEFGLQFGLVSMDEVILKSIQDMAPQANDKQITIIQHIKPLPKIWGDEERLTQVMTNLLANAIKFTPQKGTVTIIAKEKANEIKISVIDTGIGIPADKLARIFDRFYQIDGSTRRKYGGAGLGLSICKSIVERHYGSIWAQSNGKGSTFHFVLPKLMQSKKSRL